MKETKPSTVTLSKQVIEALSGLTGLLGLKKSSLISFLILEKARQEGITLKDS